MTTPTGYNDIMMMNNLQNHATNIVQTGYPIVNIVIIMMITAFMSGLINFFASVNYLLVYRWIYDKCFYHFRSKKVCIEYEGIIIMNGEKIKVTLPNEILGVNAYITKNNEKFSRIRIIKEEADSTELSFVIEQCQNIELCEDLYLTTSQSYRASNDSKVIYNHYYMELSTRTHNMDYIHKKVDEWTNDVETFYRDRYIKDDKCFVYWFNDAEFPMCNMKYEQYAVDPARTFHNLHFDGKELFMRKIDSFLNEKDNYTRVGKPHTLGILLYGDPGCGKTSIIKALANYTDRFVQYIPLQKVKTNTEFRRLFCSKYINDFKVDMDKKIIVLEDIDCLSDIVLDRALEYKVNDGNNSSYESSIVSNYEDKKNTIIVSNDDMKRIEEDKQRKREKMEMMAMMKMMGNKTKSDPMDNDQLCLSEILNCIDGPYRQDGRIMIITTNYPDRLDRALIRSGRVDIKLRLSLCDDKIGNDIIKMYFPDAHPVVIPERKLSPADLVGMCFGNSSFKEFLNTSGLYTKDDQRALKPPVLKSLEYSPTENKMKAKNSENKINEDDVLLIKKIEEQKIIKKKCNKCHKKQL